MLNGLADWSLISDPYIPEGDFYFINGVKFWEIPLIKFSLYSERFCHSCEQSGKIDESDYVCETCREGMP